MKRYAWTNHQLDRLREYCGHMSREELEREFAPHPWESICTMAKKVGGRRARDWLAICAAHKPTFDFGRHAFK